VQLFSLLEKSIEEAELVSGEKISSVYVSISGNHIQSFNATEEQQFLIIKKFLIKI
jgi:cell division ATPase FtsA